MTWLLPWMILLALSGHDQNYPPQGVILLQDSGRVGLRWTLPGKTYHLKVWSNNSKYCDQELKNSSHFVEVPKGIPMRWRVESNRGQFESDFSVANTFEYHGDGAPGLPLAGRYPGLAGRDGASLRVRLSRDAAGMHLILWHPGGRSHYLFAQPDLKFLISAHGGDGAPGEDGLMGIQSEGVHRSPTAGTDATGGGSGGHVIISTGNAPWRDYLEVDVRAGSGGRGGKGGCYPDKIFDRMPDGKSGKYGIPGKVETVIKDGW